MIHSRIRVVGSRKHFRSSGYATELVASLTGGCGAEALVQRGAVTLHGERESESWTGVRTDGLAAAAAAVVWVHGVVAGLRPAAFTRTHTRRRRRQRRQTDGRTTAAAQKKKNASLFAPRCSPPDLVLSTGFSDNSATASEPRSLRLKSPLSPVKKRRCSANTQGRSAESFLHIPQG